MKVYRVVEFDENELQIMHEIQSIVETINRYDLRDQVGFFDWNGFTGDLDRLEHYVRSHQKGKKND